MVQEFIITVLIFSVGILYTGFTNNWPHGIVEKLITNGLDITARSDEGYTLRDNLLVQVTHYHRNIQHRIRVQRIVSMH